MRKVGLTGGIASGKSIVASVLGKLNVPVYYADKRAGELINTSETIILGLKKLLGDDLYTDGRANKETLTRSIFHNPEMKTKIDDLVHPVVMEDWNRWCSRTDSGYCVMESALLFQTGYYRQMNMIVVTEAKEEVRKVRLAKRDGITQQEAAERIQSQGFVIHGGMEVPIFVIRNDDDREMLLTQVLKLNEMMRNS